MNKICSKCKIEKNISLFGKRGSELRYECKECEKVRNKEYQIRNKIKIQKQIAEYRLTHKEEIAEQRKKYRIEHKEQIAISNKNWRLKNVSYLKEYRNANKEDKAVWAKQYNIEFKDEIAEYRNKYRAEKYKNDPHFRLNQLVSTTIRESLKLYGSSKNGESKSKYLLYSIAELKIHLEKLFEPWMTWENHGIWNDKIWNDNEPSTWVWNIDHIIPKSLLPYTSMKDENFRKCWALENLRPLSAKRNILDGANRIRHYQKKDNIQ